MGCRNPLASLLEVVLAPHWVLDSPVDQLPKAELQADATIEDEAGNELLLESGPLQEEDLPQSSFVERVSIGGEETAFTGVSSPIVDVVAKRVDKGELRYRVLTATYETFWLPRAALFPEFGTMISVFEEADRKKKGLPEIRRSVWLVEANADVDDAKVLF
ncbi:hypothetical protein PInf_008318 [Phytophthora infestans]|nr:hypothetical protein PInf_008318 [Phytophthora infestans]